MAALALCALVMVGCSAPQATGSSSSTPAASDVAHDANDLGDVVCLEKVTDRYGDYCHTTIAPEAAALKLDESLIDDKALEYNGFTKDDVAEALPIALRELTEEILDPSNLDNSELSEHDAYNNDAKLASPALKARGLATVKNYGDLWMTGIFASSMLPEPGRRDGSARASGGTTVEITEITAALDPDGHSNLIFKMKAAAAFPFTDARLVTMYTEFDPTRRKDDLRSSDPQLFDGSNGSNLILNATSAVTFLRGNYAEVSAIGSSFDLATESGTSFLSNGGRYLGFLIAETGAELKRKHFPRSTLVA